ncbi:hypothetical protein L2E82_30801 [Cichorium intybus]|uniref:Uncharacterized protein n=1 Tax=Cichorium intybus TaxID=13427 RepID=A0ACB9D1U2_CICIN|nr:hypothetical protein L2E82_30801 [Cichorium intybus]
MPSSPHLRSTPLSQQSVVTDLDFIETVVAAMAVPGSFSDRSRSEPHFPVEAVLLVIVKPESHPLVSLSIHDIYLDRYLVMDLD